MYRSSVRLPEPQTNVNSYSYLHSLHRNPHDESKWMLKPFQRSDPSAGKPGEHETFLLHIQAGVSALNRPHSMLVFSGAKTERDAPFSEADSYYHILTQNFGKSAAVRDAITNGRVTCEDAATDSYQNLLFSLIKYYELKHEWPQMVTVITHSFKEARFLVCGARACTLCHVY